jgi:uncharacterized protein YcaQ
VKITRGLEQGLRRAINDFARWQSADRILCDAFYCPSARPVSPGAAEAVRSSHTDASAPGYSWLEDEVKITRGLEQGLRRAINDFARWQSADRILCRRRFPILAPGRQTALPAGVDTGSGLPIASVRSR